MEIRELTEKDKAAFDQVFAKTILNEFPEYSEKTRKWFVAEKYRGEMWNCSMKFGTFEEGKLVGYLLGPGPHGGVSYVYWLAVLQDDQKKGIGTNLLKHLEEWALRQGVHSIQLQADKRNLDYYKAKGYDNIGFDNKGYFGVNNYLMRKLIAEPKEDNFLK